MERHTFGKVERAWSEGEFTEMVQIAEQYGRHDYATVLYLARLLGLRIHECFRIDTATARDAIKMMQLTIKGKGGKLRNVPITPAVRDLSHKSLANTSPSDKLFVPKDTPTHVAIKGLQRFIRTHREKVMDADTEVPITLHGLRHSYAAEQYATSR